MKLIVLKTDLIPLNMFDDANKKWLYTKNIKHEETELSQREAFLQSKLNTKDKLILLLQAEKLRLEEQLELARTNPAKFIKQGAEVFQESAKAFSEMMRKPGDEKG
jgi:predicted nuclease with TOPRIM domain